MSSLSTKKSLRRFWSKLFGFQKGDIVRPKLSYREAYKEIWLWSKNKVIGQISLPKVVFRVISKGESYLRLVWIADRRKKNPTIYNWEEDWLEFV